MRGPPLIKCMFALSLAGLAALVAACAPAAPSPSPAPAPTATPVFPHPPPPGAGHEQVRGVVQTVAEGRLTLTGGTSATLTPETRYIRVTLKKPADLQAGQFIGVTAKPESDGTLVATHIGMFPAGSTVPAGQRPDWNDTLMSNVSITALEGNTLTVALPAGPGKVRLAPDAQVFTRETVSLDQLRSGLPVTVVVLANGNAVSVSF